MNYIYLNNLKHKIPLSKIRKRFEQGVELPKKILNKDTTGFMSQLKKNILNENICKSENFPLAV